MPVKREPCECAVTLFRVARVHTRRQVISDRCRAASLGFLPRLGLPALQLGRIKRGLALQVAQPADPRLLAEKKLRGRLSQTRQNFHPRIFSAG